MTDERNVDVERFLDGRDLKRLEAARFHDDILPEGADPKRPTRARKHIPLRVTRAQLARPDVDAETRRIAAQIKDRVQRRLHARPEPPRQALPQGKLLYTIAESAVALAVSKSTIRRALRDGRLPAVRVGRSVRVRHDDLERLAAVVSTPAPQNRAS